MRKLWGCAALIMVAPSIVHAQESSETVSSHEDEKATNAITDIIVTATKRATSSRDIPLSIDVFTGDDLSKRGLNNLAEILRYSPGVYLQPGNSPDSNQINIRGGSSSTGDFNRPFGIFYDDVPLINPTFIGTQPELDPYDMATVEVLKGPQGTLFGGSALLGAIRYVPNRPDFGSTHGEVSFGFGTVSHGHDPNQQATGMLNFATSDRFAVRFAGSVRDRAGVIDDSYSGERDVDDARLVNTRAMAEWRVSDLLSFNALFQYRKQTSDANVATAIDNDLGLQVNGRRRGGPDGSHSEQTIARIGVDWDVPGGPTLSLRASRLEKDGHLFSSAFLQELAGAEVVNPFDKYDDTKQYTYELRLVQNKSTESDFFLFNDLKYVFGIYYMKSDQNMNLQTLFDFNNPPPGFPLPNNILTGRVRAAAVAKEKALYFDVTRPLFDSLELNLGGRLFEQRTPLSLGLYLTGIAAGSGAVDPEFVRLEKLKESGFNPRAAVTWRISPRASTYVSVAKGYRFGGINLNLYNSPLVPSLFQSDSVWNYEFGARTSWFRGRLQADITAFRIDWSDRQTSQRTATEPSVEYIANTGTWKIKGIEGGLRAKLLRGFDLSLNGSYVHSISKEAYVNDGGVLVPPNTPELSTPKWNGSAILSYEGDIGDWTLNSTIGYAYRSATDSPLLNAPLEAYGSADALISISNSRAPLFPTLSLTVNNLTNSKALVAASANSPAGTAGRVFAGKTLTPRTIMLNVSFKFGRK